MAGRRSSTKGSFGNQLDELVKEFEHGSRPGRTRASDPRELQDKKDIHAKLFERAWRLDGESRDNSAP